ncbi:MAG TPA: UDP-glucose/GDP-mannose dehydrogenase family protein [Chitinivibrionales bacterium]|nr:UDP-glucose/GDP-mannose dehydrogenase family protein [Chitinivibrionales bacterium]
MPKDKCIAILGTGYVGLVAAAVFADRGFTVLASSQDKAKVDTINAGKAPFFENDLAPIIKRTVKKGTLKALHGREEAALKSDICFIAVGTPSLVSGEADLSLVKDTAAAIGKALKKKDKYSVIVARSTIVPGTTRNVIIPLLEQYSGKKAGRDFGVCMSPEFLRQGAAVKDTSEPDSVVIGEFDRKSGDFLAAFANELYKGQKVPVLRMNLESAEMVKYGRNTFLAMNISYINEMARIAESIPGIDIYEVVKGIGADWRINPVFLNAGAGYGGSCFPKDVKALISFAQLRQIEPALLETVEEVNIEQASHVVSLVRKALGELKGKRIALLGLSFKPGTDDMREAAAIKIANHLFAENADIVAYDPVAVPNAQNRFIKDTIKISYASSAEECITGADCCIVVTEWNEFKRLSAATFNKLMKRSVVIDGRRIYGPAFRDKVAAYYGIGLGMKPK